VSTTDRADAARRVRALRALGVDPGATDSERSAANDKADALEEKYGRREPPVSYPRVTLKDAYEQPPYVHPPTVNDPTWKDREDYAAWLVEDGYLWAPSDDDEDD
jgi:hypothetical protein